MPHTLGTMDNNQPIPEQYREQTLGHLFARAADPGEQVNLAVEARHRPLLVECRRVLRAWSTATGDRFASRYVHRE